MWGSGSEMNVGNLGWYPLDIRREAAGALLLPSSRVQLPYPPQNTLSHPMVVSNP